MEDFNAGLCNQKHEDMERRMNHVEQALTINLEKLYQRIELLSNDMTLIALKRLPPWITIIISVLSAAVVGLIVAAVK